MADSKDYSVIVFDMAHTGEPDGEHVVEGFRDVQAARAYAEARVRASVEELRSPDLSAEQLRLTWHIYGEDCSVIGDSFRGLEHLDHYIATPATMAQCNWSSLTPKPRRFYAALLFSDASERSAWLLKFFEHVSRPGRTKLNDLFADEAKTKLAKEQPVVEPITVHVASLFELPDPPISDAPDQANWLVKVDFVCHDIKFGGSGSVVFRWPEKPVGWALDRMVRVVVADVLAMRGDGPSYLDYTDILTVSVEKHQ